MSLATRPFRAGLQEIADGVHAWLAPDGSWGWSNAGLVVDGDASMVVDTLFDLPLTAAMLEAMAAVAPGTRDDVEVLVNTHANGDHCHGNELVPARSIIASAATADEMSELPPAALHAMMASVADDDSPRGRYLRHAFGAFDFSGITPTLPTTTFQNSLSLMIGDTAVELIDVGPAHTRGDVLVHLPDRGVVFTGDILFIEGTPLMWAGPVRNWIAACETIAAMDAVVVPGHGPITDQAGAEAVGAYWRFLERESRLRFDAGMSVVDAARDIDLGSFADWGESERVVLNVNTLYREFGSDRVVDDLMGLFDEMGTLWLKTGSEG